MGTLGNHWYIACRAQELCKKAIARTILGTPLVLFRNSNGQPTAFLDRCPHRNVPLSQGWVKQDHLTCRYHGWQFNPQGVCTTVPGRCSQAASPARNVRVYPAIEQDQFIWVWLGNESQAEEVPIGQPYQFPAIAHPQFSTFYWSMDCQTSLENLAENFLDATHTHFVHSGLIRTDRQRQTVTVKITRQDDRVEAVYWEEGKISGLMYRLLAPGCRDVVSIGRFILPAIAQLEYRTDKDNQIFISLFITPTQDHWVRAYGVVTFRWGWPNWLGKLIARPLFYQAAQQDKAILQLQTANIQRFQGENFVSTELDVLRPHILDLLQQAVNPNNAGASLMEPYRSSFSDIETTVRMNL